MYAQLCKQLSEKSDADPQSTAPTFRHLLLNKCRDEFENRSRINEQFDCEDGMLSQQQLEQRGIAKRKMLGNIRVSKFFYNIQ